MATWRSDLDHVLAVGIVETFDPISGREEGVESLDKGRMAFEQVGYTINDSRCVDTGIVSMTESCPSNIGS